MFWYATSERTDLFKYAKDRLLELFSKTTAVVCYNDRLAIELMHFCKENSIRIPKDLSVVGIDDCHYAAICDVPLTTVRHPHRKLGETAAKILLSMIERGVTDPEDRIFQPELIVRQSVEKK